MFITSMEQNGDKGWSFHSRILPPYHQFAIVVHPTKYEGLAIVLSHEAELVTKALDAELYWRLQSAVAQGPALALVTEAQVFSRRSNEVPTVGDFPLLDKEVGQNRVLWAFQSAVNTVLQRSVALEHELSTIRTSIADKRNQLQQLITNDNHGEVDDLYFESRRETAKAQRDVESLRACSS